MNNASLRWFVRPFTIERFPNGQQFLFNTSIPLVGWSFEMSATKRKAQLKCYLSFSPPIDSLKSQLTMLDSKKKTISELLLRSLNSVIISF